MTNKFTPGPWKATNLPITPGWMIEVGNMILIATIEPGHSSAEQVVIPLSEQEGNARLIAAAPELFELAQEALHNCIIDNHAGSDDFDCKFCNKARAAIAKVLGQ